LQTPLAAAPMSGLLTKAEIAQGSMSNSECFDSPASSFETRSRPRFLAATLATLPSMSLFPKAPFDLSVFACSSLDSQLALLKIARFPHSLIASLATLPSMSLIPFGPFASRQAQPLLDYLNPTAGFAASNPVII